jgi:FkbM family methyltransferase
VLDGLIDQLPAGSTFVDVGANLGRFTLRAARRGLHVIAVEPSPVHLVGLLEQVEPGMDVEWHNCAAGRSLGMCTLSVTNDGNDGWNTIVPGFMLTEFTAYTIPVPVVTLDSLVADRPVALVKIDVEGAELPVVEGAARLLGQGAPVFMEIAPAAYPLLGRTVTELCDLMAGFGYRPNIDPLALTGTEDVLWVR